MFYTSYESICASILNATIRFREIYGFMQAGTELYCSLCKTLKCNFVLSKFEEPQTEMMYNMLAPFGNSFTSSNILAI